MFLYRLFFFIFLLITFIPVYPSQYKATFVDLMTSLNAVDKDSSFYLANLSFESDVPFSQEEFLYLTGLNKDKFFTVKDLYKAYKSLMYKKRFNKIEIEVCQDKQGKNIHFKLIGNWIFKRLVLRNIWFDKDQYTNLYLQQPGDVFDLSLHEESVRTLKKYMHDSGYFNGTVGDELIYKKRDKTILVKLSIKNKRCFDIANIKFEVCAQGGIEELDQALMNKFGWRLSGKDYSKKLLLKQVENIRNFFKKKGFLSCHISVKRLINNLDHKVDLVFNIKLGKKKVLKFLGNEFFTDKQLRQEFLGKDFPDWLFKTEIIAQHLLYEYRKRGFWGSVVYYKQEGSVLTFDIKENLPIIINNIKIKDSQTGSLINKNNFFDNLLSKKEFDEKLLQEGIEKLKNYYLTQGFWDFTITDKKFEKQSQNECSIILFVSPGKQRFWGGFKIDDFTYLEKTDFLKKYSYDTKDELIPFNYYWLQEQKSFLIRHFQSKSYWYVYVYPELDTYFDEQHEVTKAFVTWKVTLGPRIRFGKVLVRGNSRLPFDRIIKELRFSEGDLWDRKKIDLSRSSLKKLDIFKDVQLQPYKLSKDKSERKQPLVLTLVDDDPVQAKLRLGYFLTSKNFLFKRESTYKVGGSIVIKNITNNADKLLFNADFTRFERKVNFDYQQPDPLGFSFKDFFLMGRLKAYTNKYIHPVEIGQSGSAFEATQHGFSLGLNSEYRKAHFWGISLGNEWINTSRVRGDLNFDPDMVNRTLPYFFIEPNFIIDKLDDKINVKKGSLTFFALRFMIPENTGEVTGKLMFEQSLFYPVFNDFIGCLRIRLGHVFRQEFDQVQPIERFYLGGPYSVRGYEKDAIPPLGVLVETNPDGVTETLYTIQGGSSMINGNAEIRFPIYKAFGGVVFQDIGVLSQTGFSGFRGKWYPATGFGFRYQTPIGALRFDIGWKWKHRLVGDSAYAWYLTLGQAF